MNKTVGTLLLSALTPLASFAENARPNILFIFSDDHATAAISAYGDSRKLLETPSLDRLSEEGMRFDRCLVPNSICGPSRATILTGKYSHQNGVYNNIQSRFDGSQQTFPKLLRAAGYQTALVGKWHLKSEPTGFDHWNILPGQGAYYNPVMIDNGKRKEHEGYVTDLIADHSIEWLENRDPSKPFLLMSQHKAPHRNWAPALRHLGHDGDRAYPEPPTLFDDLRSGDRGLAWRDQHLTLEEHFNDADAKLKPPARLTAEQREVWDAYYEPRNREFREADLSGKDLVRWRYQRYMHDYLACIKAVDESVGRLLDYLEESGLAENTIVVYSSDQGFFLGEHGIFDKRWILEESIRTPLLVRWPGVTEPGSLNRDMVSVVDFAQTFLEMASLPQPADMQGRSLLPLLRGETPADWRKSFYYHFYEFPFPGHVRPHYGVVTSRYKLVHYYRPDVDDWELYDLEKGPLETRNFIHDPAYAPVIEELRGEIVRLRAELKVPDQVPPSAYGRQRTPPKADEASDQGSRRRPQTKDK